MFDPNQPLSDDGSDVQPIPQPVVAGSTPLPQTGGSPINVQIPQQMPIPQDGVPGVPQGPKRVDTSQAIQIIRDEVNQALQDMGRDVTGVQDSMNLYLTAIEPDLDDALATGDLRSMNYLKSTIVVHLGRISLGLINKEKQTVSAVVIAVVRTLIKVAIAAA